MGRFTAVFFFFLVLLQVLSPYLYQNLRRSLCFFSVKRTVFNTEMLGKLAWEQVLIVLFACLYGDYNYHIMLSNSIYCHCVVYLSAYSQV